MKDDFDWDFETWALGMSPKKIYSLNHYDFMKWIKTHSEHPDYWQNKNKVKDDN